MISFLKENWWWMVLSALCAAAFSALFTELDERRATKIIEAESDFYGCIEITINHNVAWCYDKFIKPIVN